MKKKLILVTLLILGCMSGIYAQDADSNAKEPKAKKEKPAKVHFTGTEEWYLQAQGGLNFLGAEYALNPEIGLRNMLSGNGAFTVGKNFTTYWGMRLHLLGGGDKLTYNMNENSKDFYTFSHIGAFAEVTFNITTLFRKDKAPKPWNIYAMFGPGVLYSFGFDGENPDFNNHVSLEKNTTFALYGGFETSYRFTPHWDFNFGITTNWMGDKYNGIVGGRKYEGHLNIMFGFGYIF